MDKPVRLTVAQRREAERSASNKRKKDASPLEVLEELLKHKVIGRDSCAENYSIHKRKMEEASEGLNEYKSYIEELERSILILQDAQKRASL